MMIKEQCFTSGDSRGWTRLDKGLPEPGVRVLGVVHRQEFPGDPIVVDIDFVELYVAVDNGNMLYRWILSDGEEPDYGVTHWMHPPELPDDIDYRAYHKTIATQDVDVVTKAGHYLFTWDEASNGFRQWKENEDTGEMEPNDEEDIWRRE